MVHSLMVVLPADSATPLPAAVSTDGRPSVPFNRQGQSKPTARKLHEQPDF